jgi:hypothetical protein
LPCESKRGAGPACRNLPGRCYAVGTSPRVLVLGAALPFKLLAALVAKQNSTAREKPVHPIKTT